jgi:D-alanyl-D-alanine carboxypeptidase/D-alanyl-D-alanine-endopeptidase (penicillin-binding protein 4)
MRNKKLESINPAGDCMTTYSFLISHFLFLIILPACSLQKQISRSATTVIQDSSLKTAHVGISIYEPETGKYWYNHNADKYFIPASNIKIPTCYAAMKYLGDSLAGLKYSFSDAKDSASMFLCIQPTGDPTFLHRDYKKQPAYDFIKRHPAIDSIGVLDTIWKEQAWGDGWSWNDYNSYYMAERSPLPVYGNMIRFVQVKEIEYDGRFRENSFIYTEPEITWELNFGTDTSNKNFSVQRDLSKNSFNVNEGKEEYKEQDVPFVTHGKASALELLRDSLQKEFIGLRERKGGNRVVYETITDERPTLLRLNSWNIIRSRPTDSLLRPMMHRSDNFFAEQTLLMVSNELLGVMSDQKIIDTLLQTDFKDLPQKPRWADGSGLSRYNLFTPQDFIAILNKMNKEFGMERIKSVFPTGGEGTLSNYYQADKNFIYAKTGSLSGVVALSGYLYTGKNKFLIFSVLVNNHQASATDVRRAVEKFLHGVRINN